MKRVGILVFDDVEVLDFAGPFEVFSITGGDAADREEGAYETTVVAVDELNVVARNGLKVEADVVFSNCPALDVLVVPGGWGTRAAMKNAPLLAWIAELSESLTYLTSVCTGSFVLAAAGLLDGRPATTHIDALDWLQQQFPQVKVKRDGHVVRDGNTFTAAGISAGIDMALTVVADDLGETTARQTARYMEYPFPESNHRRV
ncbi:MAG: DJ-1/PfpI family protein [Pseudomonadota bacterium]